MFLKDRFNTGGYKDVEGNASLTTDEPWTGD